MPEAHHCRRHDLGLLIITGRDARSFLHAQITQAINDIEPTETRLAAWLSAKGRVRALFDLVPSGDAIWLITEADTVEWLADELKRFVFRADVQLGVVADQAVYSCYGDVEPALQALGIELDRGQFVERNGAVWLRPKSGPVLAFGPPDALAESLPGTTDEESNDAILTTIRAGRPAMPASLRERHTSHMLNLDRLDAISFSKGCYPGQEIVARTENLGTVKRRLQRFRIDPGREPSAGDTIIDTDDQSIGDINCVASTDAGYEMLAVVPVESGSHSLRLESDGRRLTALPLTTEPVPT